MNYRRLVQWLDVTLTNGFLKLSITKLVSPNRLFVIFIRFNFRGFLKIAHSRTPTGQKSSDCIDKLLNFDIENTFSVEFPYNSQ